MFTPVDPKKSFPDLEHEVLNTWEKEDTFQKSLEQNRDKKKFVFFDGPPFANGLPHYGHILANSLKDAVTRYFSMRGYYVPRTNGWDCHGLPVEYEIEKELGLSGKKDIENMGIENFNRKCRESVFRYTKEWEGLLKRIARWVDFNQSYATLENRYMESIWNVFKQIWDKELVFQSYKSMHICPRCETPLSNFEVTQGYKDVTDFSATSQFKLHDHEDTYVIAWTTTPWTLPGNCALAVHPEVTYAYVKNDRGTFILAKDLIEANFKDQDYVIDKEVSGADLIGLSYEPLFPYYKDKDLEGIEKAWKVIPGDFVTTENGTGVVHIAGGYGEDDMQSAKKHGIPIIQHVGIDGCFKPEVTDFAGKFVKGQDRNIADYLEKKGLLFSSENYRHSYPHCWRCDTPLLNYSTKSWFVKVTAIKDQLLENNKKIHWQPGHIKEGRFGKWLDGARDWAISRNRFWGCAIPVWECTDCEKHECIGSIEELVEKTTNTVTEVLIVRHGQTDYNRDDRWQGQSDIPLNDTGIKQAEAAASTLKDEAIDVIYSSDLSRAVSTAEIIAHQFGHEVTQIPALKEKSNGEFEGMLGSEIIEKNAEEWAKRCEDRYSYTYPGGESCKDVEARAIPAFKKIVQENKGKKILIVSHEGVIRMLKKYYEDLSPEQAYRYHPQNGEVLRFKIIHKEQYPDHLKADLHKPYIDDVEIKCDCGGTMRRIPEVLDCWFESGSMPYAQLHYPFENKDEFEANFPADFIAEGLDQTRGWFYTLHVLSTILFESPAFNNVIVNGILLAADGEKLSKRKKNYPDPNKLFETKGVDATRFFLYQSTAPLAQDVRFSENHVDEIVKKLLLTLWNCYSFFVTYANIDGWNPAIAERNVKPSAELDKWIISELNELIGDVTKNMDDYNLTEATRPLMTFVENLSNWYVRRSRRRFWKSENDGDKDSAYTTLYTVLTTYAKLLAPFCPFISDYIHRNLTGKSVHLESWPEADSSTIDEKLNSNIALVRKVINLGHGVRAKTKIKVRQPLSRVRVGVPSTVDPSILDEQKQIILEELNVKELELVDNVGDIVKMVAKPDARKLGPRFGKAVQEIIQKAKAGEFTVNDDGSVQIGDHTLDADEIEIGFESDGDSDVESQDGIVTILDTMITDELKKEGIARDLVRVIQDLRKAADYQVDDRIYVSVKAPGSLKDAVDAHADYIMQETLANELQGSGDLEWDQEREVTIDGENVKVAVKKA